MFRIYYRVRTANGGLAPYLSVYDCSDDEDYERVLTIARRDNYEIINVEYISVQ